MFQPHFVTPVFLIWLKKSDFRDLTANRCSVLHEERGKIVSGDMKGGKEGGLNSFEGGDTFVCFSGVVDRVVKHIFARREGG